MKRSKKNPERLRTGLGTFLGKIEEAHRETANTVDLSPDDEDGKVFSEQRAINLFKRLAKEAGIPTRFMGARLADAVQDLAPLEGKLIAANFAKVFAESGGRVMHRDAYRHALLICGGFGTGKTWLATAAFIELMWKKRHGKWRKFHHLIRSVQSTYSSAARFTSSQIINEYQTTPLLLLDDVGDMDIEHETEDRRRIFYEILDSRNDMLLPTIITTNLNPDELEKQFGERTFQRIIEMCAIVELSGINFRLKGVDDG